MAVPNWLAYANQGATRDLPLNNKLVEALGFLPEMGVTMKVFSGGQPSEGPDRVGSHRHDMGNAADVFFFKDGRQLSWENPNDLPIFEQIVERSKANGVTGFGAGEGYMRPGSLHIGFGTPAVWGAGGKGANAPDWLRTAYNAQPGAPSPAQPAPTGMLASRGMLSAPAPSGSLAPTSAPSPLPIEVAQYAASGDDKQESPFQSLLKGIAEGIPNPPPPRPGGFPGGPSSGQANGLLKAALAGPTLANLLMSKRV